LSATILPAGLTCIGVGVWSLWRNSEAGVDQGPAADRPRG
jgi:hypothetical protein